MSTRALYCLLVHDSPKQTLRLLRAIYNIRDRFVIHVDRSARLDYLMLMERVSREFQNIGTISNYRGSWGGYSLVRAECDMLRWGLENSNDWTHAVFLSGTHFPLLSCDEIRTWLPIGKSVMTWNKVSDAAERPDDPWVAAIWERFRWNYEEEEGVGMRRLDLAEVLMFDYFTGSQWIVLAREHAKYAVRDQSDSVRARLARTNVSDEAYFQTILLNSIFRTEIVWGESTHVMWRPGASRPEVIGLEEYIELVGNCGSPFLRKMAEHIGDEDESRKLFSQKLGVPFKDEYFTNLIAEL